MAILDRFRHTTLEDVTEDHDFVGWTEDNSAMMFAARPIPRTYSSDGADLRELGWTGQSNLVGFAREEYNPKLRGLAGLKIYDEMRRSDSQVRATLRLIKTPILAGTWYMEPATEDPLDVEVAEFVWDNLTKWMSISWAQVLYESLLMVDFGYYMFEKVWTVRDDKIVWKKLAPRHPMDVQEWVMDDHGGPRGLVMYAPDDLFYEEGVFIPIDKLLVFSFDKEAGNLEGMSLLRSAYKPWYFKNNLYKIDAIQKERHGIGIPIIKLPANFTDGDKTLANEIGKNLRTNEKAHIVLPPNWVIEFADVKGNPVDAMSSIEHHDKQIARNVLGQFINASSGSTELGEVNVELFNKATRYVSEFIKDTFNKYAIPQLVDFNFDVERYPELRFRRIGETTDWRTISFAIRNFVGAGIITPDEKLEEWTRNEMDLPRPQPSTARVVATPQKPEGEEVEEEEEEENLQQANAGRTTDGRPRQSQAANMRGMPKSNAGRDDSGG